MVKSKSSRPLSEEDIFTPDDILPGDEDSSQEATPSFEHFRLSVDPGQEPVRIDRFMASHLENTSRSRIQNAIKSGYVFINDAPAKANILVKPGDIIKFMMPYEKRHVDIQPEDIPLDIVYEDDDVLVVNKPAGMVVHPGNGHYTHTLLNALAFHLGLRDTEDERMGVLVHRIDMDTSGLLVVAKNEGAQLKLAKQFFDHSIDRRYVAVVWGNLKEDEGTIEGNIARDPGDRLKFRVDPTGEKGKPAVTHYKVLERFGFVTVVECKLETGRTHQIRVHMTYIGHPLFNDERYGGAEIRKGTIYSKYKQFIRNCFALCQRQALHAKTLGFVHPSLGEWMQFDSVLPSDMEALLEKWRKYSANMPVEEDDE